MTLQGFSKATSKLFYINIVLFLMFVVISIYLNGEIDTRRKTLEFEAIADAKVLQNIQTVLITSCCCMVLTFIYHLVPVSDRVQHYINVIQWFCRIGAIVVSLLSRYCYIYLIPIDNIEIILSWFVVLSLLNIIINAVYKNVYKREYAICVKIAEEYSHPIIDFKEFAQKLLNDNAECIKIGTRIRNIERRILIPMFYTRESYNKFDPDKYLVDELNEYRPSSAENDVASLVKLYSDYQHGVDKYESSLKTSVIDTSQINDIVGASSVNANLLQVAEYDTLHQICENTAYTIFGITSERSILIIWEYETPARHELRQNSRVYRSLIDLMNCFSNRRSYSSGQVSRRINIDTSNVDINANDDFRRNSYQPNIGYSNSYRYSDRSRSVSKSQRQRILRRDKFTCQLCGAHGPGWRDANGNPDPDPVQLEVDHKLPFSRGGTDDDSNLWTLCMPCNRGKSDKYDDSKM